MSVVAEPKGPLTEQLLDPRAADSENKQLAKAMALAETSMTLLMADHSGTRSWDQLKDIGNLRTAYSEEFRVIADTLRLKTSKTCAESLFAIVEHIRLLTEAGIVGYGESAAAVLVDGGSTAAKRAVALLGDSLDEIAKARVRWIKDPAREAEEEEEFVAWFEEHLGSEANTEGNGP